MIRYHLARSRLSATIFWKSSPATKHPSSLLDIGILMTIPDEEWLALLANNWVSLKITVRVSSRVLPVAIVFLLLSLNKRDLPQSLFQFSASPSCVSMFAFGLLSAARYHGTYCEISHSNREENLAAFRALVRLMQRTRRIGSRNSTNKDTCSLM